VHHRGIAPVAELAASTKFSTRDGKTEGLNFEGFPNTELSGAPAATRVDRRVALTGPFFKGSDSGRGSSARWAGHSLRRRPDRIVSPCKPLAATVDTACTPTTNSSVFR
jgi:hypothetical protein